MISSRHSSTGGDCPVTAAPSGGFGNSVNLLPDHNLGYFFSFNGECYQTSLCGIISAFRDEFLERFF